MNEIKIADARINSFGQFAQAPSTALKTFPQTIEELQDIITEALQPLQDRISQLEDTVIQLEDMLALRAQEIAQDRQRITKLEVIEPTPAQQDRGEVLQAILAANGGKMLAKDARHTMRLPESRFSELLATVPEVGKRPFYLNKKQNIIYLKSVFPKG